MAKKKDKPQVINNIGEINLEIDYDKLAQAMIKAQEKSENEDNDEKRFMSRTLVMLIAMFFRFVAFVGLMFLLISPFRIANMVGSFVWNEFVVIVINVLKIGVEIGVVFALAAYSHISFKLAKEIETEKDRNYIVSVFSGIVSLAALIVALVALFKGVG